MKPGDLIKSDLDGKIYSVVKFGTRDELDPLPGVKLIGNAVIAIDETGQKILLYEWEWEKVNKT